MTHNQQMELSRFEKWLRNSMQNSRHSLCVSGVCQSCDWSSACECRARHYAARRSRTGCIITPISSPAETTITSATSLFLNMNLSPPRPFVYDRDTYSERERWDFRLTIGLPWRVYWYPDSWMASWNQWRSRAHSWWSSSRRRDQLSGIRSIWFAD